jgi:hypothetical protein
MYATRIRAWERHTLPAATDYGSAHLVSLRLLTDRKLLLALRGVGPESEAESVRFHGRRVTKAGLQVKHRPPECRTELAAASFPKLLISGGHSAGFEAICDDLAERIGAPRAVVVKHAPTLAGPTT